MSDQSVTVESITYDKPVTYDQFMGLAQKFHAAVETKFPGPVGVSIQGAEVMSVRQREDGTTSTASVVFTADSLDDFSKDDWENLPMSRVVFYPDEPGTMAAVFFDMDDPFSLDITIIPDQPDLFQALIAPAP